MTERGCMGTPPNKEMQLTMPVKVAASQLISSVRQTKLGERAHHDDRGRAACRRLLSKRQATFSI